MRQFLFLLSLATILGACGKDDDEPITLLTANINGTVHLYSIDGAKLMEAEGVQVKLEGTSIPSANTLTNGSYVLPNIPFDNYNVIFDKTGYGKMIVFGITHGSSGGSSGTTLNTVRLSQVQDIGVSALKISPADSIKEIRDLIALGLAENALMLNPVFTLPSGRKTKQPVIYFFGDSTYSDLSSSKFLFFERNVSSGSGNEVSTDYDISWFRSKGFTPGQRIYIRAYTDSYGNNEYIDPRTGRVFPCLNPTASPAILVRIPG